MISSSILMLVFQYIVQVALIVYTPLCAVSGNAIFLVCLYAVLYITSYFLVFVNVLCLFTRNISFITLCLGTVG